jgi:hypothetical protein
MLKFSDLTKSQKTFITRMLEIFPEYYSEKNLNAKQIHAAYYKLKELRASTDEKLGYPNWLQNKNRVGRGEYKMPWPTETELKAVPQVKVAKTKDLDASKLQKIIDDSPEVEVEYQSDDEFMQELRDNGINV